MSLYRLIKIAQRSRKVELTVLRQKVIRAIARFIGSARFTTPSAARARVDTIKQFLSSRKHLKPLLYYGYRH